MGLFVVGVLLCLTSITPWLALGALVQYNFTVGTMKVTKLCKEQEIACVNGQFPGPTIYAREGDNVVIHVKNDAPYNISLHWHGIKQFQTGWADGPAYITQCPLIPGTNYTYNFTIIEQRGTLWWHAHITFLRATVYGALIISPRYRHHYPFPRPANEFHMILGEWWNANVEDVLAEFVQLGLPNNSDAYTINGHPGDLYPCSANDTFRILVERGKTYLLRIINAALNEPLFFKIAKHKLTVVAVDACYTKPYETHEIVLYPGQTTDVLITAAKRRGGSYYMASRAYESGVAFINNSTTRAIMEYKNNNCNETAPPKMPHLPPFNDTPAVMKFNTEIRSLFPCVPQTVDQEIFITAGLGFKICPTGTCQLLNGSRIVGSFNNISFVRPHIALLQAHFFGLNDVFTTDFPDKPPLAFNYTASVQSPDFLLPDIGTKVKVLEFNSNVQIVFQGTSILSVESHPIHIHGFDFYIVGQGFGNYDPQIDPGNFNLVDPPLRNTIGLPTGGWTAIRFKANNSGVWFVHCHFEVHSEFGFNMAFLVKNGPEKSQKLHPPPPDLPQC